jgi:hypothetical protein
MSLTPKTFADAQERAARYSQNRRAKLALKPPRKPILRFGGEKHAERSGIAKNHGSGKPRKRLKAGRRTKEWDAERRKLKIRFAAVGITWCEALAHNIHPCSFDDFLGFAHDAKRRKLTKEDLGRVILLCNNMHDIIEQWEPEVMKKFVNDIIAAREVQP